MPYIDNSWVQKNSKMDDLKEEINSMLALALVYQRPLVII